MQGLSIGQNLWFMDFTDCGGLVCLATSQNGKSPAHAAFAVAGVTDFFNRVFFAQYFAFHAPAATIEVYPRFFVAMFPEGGGHRTIFLNRTRFAVFTLLRINQRPFHIFIPILADCLCLKKTVSYRFNKITENEKNHMIC